MTTTILVHSFFARRWSALLIAIILFALATSSAHAGFIVGIASGNDDKPNVLSLINAYNTSNDPALPTDFDLFKKTDDDAAFVFNLANGFKFYKDELLTMQIFTEAALTALPEAWFTYSGPENLLYYSDKSASRFSLWTYMAGANRIAVPGHNNEISHVSFWSGPVPEPGTFALAALGLVGVFAMRSRLTRS